jgi:hypothetical protein
MWRIWLQYGGFGYYVADLVTIWRIWLLYGGFGYNMADLITVHYGGFLLQYGGLVHRFERASGLSRHKITRGSLLHVDHDQVQPIGII